MSGDAEELHLRLLYRNERRYAAGRNVAVHADGKDDARVLELRRQQGLRLHGAGRTTSGVRVLEGLAADLERLRGPDGRMLQGVRELVERIRGGMSG